MMIEELEEMLNTDTTLTLGAGVGGATYAHLVQDNSTAVIATLTITFLAIKIIFLLIIKILEVRKKLREDKTDRRKGDKK